MTTWDAWRNDRKGKTAPSPKCSECGKTSLFDPCRACAPELDTERPAPPPPDTLDL